MRRLAPLLTVVTSTTLAFSQLATAQRHPVNDVRYRCADGTRLRVRYYDDAARVTLRSGRVIALPQRRSASGIRYSNATFEFWEHQDEAGLTRRGRDLYGVCKPAERP